VKNDLAPIVLFVYNRPWHTEQTLNALMQNELAAESILYIFADGPKTQATEELLNNIAEVRRIIRSKQWCKEVHIIERSNNYGLGNNIIAGVTEIVNKYGKVIVLEDDLLTSPYFLKYMNDGLNKYSSANNIISVHAYIYPIKKKLPETFFIRGADCLGWATWKEKWELFESDGRKLLSELEGKGLSSEFDFNNAYSYTQMLKDQIAEKNSSWAVRWYASAFINNMLTLYPGRSLIYHNGNDGSGTNFGVSSVLDVKLSETPVEVLNIPLVEGKSERKKIEYYLKHHNASFLRIIYRKLKRALVTRITR